MPIFRHAQDELLYYPTFSLWWVHTPADGGTHPLVVGWTNATNIQDCLRNYHPRRRQLDYTARQCSTMPVSWNLLSPFRPFDHRPNLWRRCTLTWRGRRNGLRLLASDP